MLPPNASLEYSNSPDLLGAVSAVTARASSAPASLFGAFQARLSAGSSSRQSWRATRLRSKHPQAPPRKIKPPGLGNSGAALLQLKPPQAPAHSHGKQSGPQPQLSASPDSHCQLDKLPLAAEATHDTLQKDDPNLYARHDIHLHHHVDTHPASIYEDLPNACSSLRGIRPGNSGGHPGIMTARALAVSPPNWVLDTRLEYTHHLPNLGKPIDSVNGLRAAGDNI